MPRSKRASVKLRGFETAFSRIFGVGTMPPVGRLKLTRKGSGYFGNWRGEKPREGHELVFNLGALPMHAKAVEKVRKFNWAQPSIITHTGLWVFPKNKRAIITVIQPTADLKKASLSAKEKRQYRYANIATTIASIEYCKRKGLRLFAVHPKNYQALHEQGGEMGLGVVKFYKRTLENAAEGLGFKWANTTIYNSGFWRDKGRFFGGELLELEK